MLAPGESSQGAHKFHWLLRNELSERHPVIDWYQKEMADVSIARGMLSEPQISYVKPRTQKLVIQYGGTDVSPASLSIFKSTLDNADAIVFNSAFGRKTINKMLNIPEHVRQTVIHNGALPAPPAPLSDPVFLVACDNYDLPTKKRALDATINAMSIIKSEIPDATLCVLGVLPKNEKGINIRPGYVTEPGQLQKARSSASVLIHLVEYDNCPNTVLETMAQGIPVVYHAKSGTGEIVGEFGAGCQSLKPQEIASAAIAAFNGRKTKQTEAIQYFNDKLSINAIAKKYELFFRRITKCTA